MTVRYVITGAAGLVGRGLVRRLTLSGAHVIGVDKAVIEEECERRELDLTMPGALAPLLDARTTVFHLAGLTSVAGSVREPRKDFEVNVLGFLNVIEAVRERGSKMVYTSSASVFDPRSPLPHKEAAPKSPNSPYAAAKLAGEGYAAAYHKCYGVDVRIARLFNAYGPGMKQFAIYDFYKKIRAATDEIEILGDGMQVRDYVYLDDVIEGLLTIAARGEAGEDYNLATGVATTSMDVAQLMADLMGRAKLRIRTTPKTFPGDVKAWYADIAKIRGLGFAPRFALREGLLRTIQSFDSEHCENASVPA